MFYQSRMTGSGFETRSWLAGPGQREGPGRRLQDLGILLAPPLLQTVALADNWSRNHFRPIALFFDPIL